MQRFNWEDTLWTVGLVAVTLLLAYLLLKGLKKALEKQEKIYGAKIHIKFIYNIMRLFIIVVATATIGSQFSGFDKAINTVLASSGIIALGLSLAAQESLGNIIDGLFLSMFQPFNIGDRITLPEKSNLTGVVTEMNLRHTIITTYSNTSYIVPNKVMNSAIIDNSNFGNKVFAYPIDVSVSYESDLEKAMQIMKNVIVSQPKFVDPRSPEQIEAGAPKVTVLAREFGDSGISLRCQMFTRNVGESFAACSEARVALKKAFDENGIVIPYQTITVKKEGGD